MSTKIAKTSNNNCGGRAISTMRLALGYEQGLPRDWENGSKEVYELISLLGGCFPGRTVWVCCGQREADQVTFWADNVNYAGDTIAFNVEGGLHTDEHLVAFVYSDHNTREGHMVIGTPAIYNPDAFIISLIIAVSLDGG